MKHYFFENGWFLLVWSYISGAMKSHVPQSSPGRAAVAGSARVEIKPSPECPLCDAAGSRLGLVHIQSINPLCGSTWPWATWQVQGVGAPEAGSLAGAMREERVSFV